MIRDDREDDSDPWDWLGPSEKAMTILIRNWGLRMSEIQQLVQGFDDDQGRRYQHRP